MYTYPWYHWITFFFIYSFFGWIFESTYVSLLQRRFVNRGFLRIPMLPLYGTGAVMMLWLSLPVQDSVVLVYFAGVVGATVLEYVTGYVMEKLFKMKYWDYSNQPFNLHGYICLSSSVAWGFLTIFLTEVIHRPIAEFVLGMNPWAEAVLLVVVGAVFAADTVVSVKEALDLGKALEAMTKMKAELDNLQVQAALLRSELEQRLESVSAAEMRAEASNRLTEVKADAAAKVTVAAGRVAEAAASFIHEHVKSEEALTARIRALTEKRETLAGHMNFYRRNLLRGNPSASSVRFAAALKELREKADRKSDI